MSRPTPTVATLPKIGERVGYLVAVVVNGVLLYVVNRLLEWDLLPLLTTEFTQVLPLVNLSLVVSLLAYLSYLWYDPAWFKSTTQAVASAVSLAATWRVLSVFPFEFDLAGFDWAIVFRAVLIVALGGTAIGIVVEVAKLARAATPAR